MKIKKGKISAFTLIELILGMALLLPFLSVIIWMANHIVQSQLYYIEYDALVRDQAFIEGVIKYDLNRMTEVVIPATQTAVFSEMQILTNSGLVSYSSASGVLIRQDSTGSAQLHSSRVSLEDFSVSRTGTEAGLLKLELKLEASEMSESKPKLSPIIITHQIK